jgi:histidyl-tRNA synthetase
MTAANTQPARGMRDFLPDEVRRREYVIGVIADVYQRYGFEPLETPAAENIDTLIGKYGEEGDRLIFRILKRGEEARSGETDLALRYDLTVPLARVVAEYRGRLPRFFKRYQVQPVWRADRPQKGRFREFYQCDVDIVGSTSAVVEVELCAAVCDVLRRLGFTDFTLRVNHRHVLSGLLDAAGAEASLHGTVLVALDKLDKIGASGVERELVSRAVPADVARRLLTTFESASTLSAAHLEPAAYNREVLRMLESAVEGAPAAGARTGQANLAEIVGLAAPTSAGPHLRVDPSLARGLSYYTGAIMEIAVADLAGSLGGGGRYDDLVGMFLGQPVPACGFSLGLERILVVMAERGMFPPALTRGACDALVTLWSRERTADALALAASLRGAGLRVDVYPEPDKLGKQLKYAATLGVPFAVIVGDDEAARGEVTVKNMRTGEQRSVARQDVAALLKAEDHKFA